MFIHHSLVSSFIFATQKGWRTAPGFPQTVYSSVLYGACVDIHVSFTAL